MLLLILISFFPQGFASDFQSNRIYDIDIPVLDCAAALTLFAEQVDASLIFPYKKAKTLQANAVKGRYTLAQALAKLLKGSGLEGGFSDVGSIKITTILTLKNNEEITMPQKLPIADRSKSSPFFATLVSALFATSQAQAAINNSSVIEEVLVTSQKREQSLQKVPISETVLSAEAIKNAHIDSGTEIARQTPNLRVSLLGNESQPKFSLRGVSTATFNLNAISPVGVFYDEVYVGMTYQGGAQMFDIERVEVLRGPQGTLFGKNTTGGAINFISKKPTYEMEGYLTAGVGSNGYTDYKGAIEIPIVSDRLTARLAFTGAHSDGYIENVNPAGRDLSSIDRQAVRLTVGYRNDDGFDATLRIFNNEENPDAIGAIVYGLFPGDTNAAGLNPRVNPFNGQPLANDETSTDRSGIIEGRAKGANLTLVKDFDSVSLTSITSYLDGSFLNLVDADGSIAPVIHIDFGSEDKEISQDIRLTSNNESAFNWILGLYYYNSDIDVDTRYRIFEGFPTGSVLAQTYSQTRESYAVYTDVTYELNDTYTVYGGLRFTDDEGTMENFQVAVEGTPFFAIAPQSDVTYSDSEPTGRLGLRAQLNDNFMLYGQFVYGYRSSDINGGALNAASDLTVAKPEKLKSYEIGMKSQWLDRRVTLNASAFYYDFTDQQFIDVVAITDQKLVNAGKSNIMGLEIETLLQITDNFRVSLGLGLLDTEYEELQLSGGDFSGNELIEAPDYTFNFAADYSLPIKDTAMIDFHIDGTAVDSQHFSATNDESFLVDSFFDLGARIAYRPLSERFEVAVYGKNLTDNDDASGLQQAPDFGVSFTTVPYPRRYGVEVTYNF